MEPTTTATQLPVDQLTAMFGIYTNLVVFIVVALFGMVSHYIKLAAASQVEKDIWKYFFTTYGFRSFAAAIAIIGVALGFYVTGSLAPSVPLILVISSALTTGYSADSLLNKGQTPTVVG